MKNLWIITTILLIALVLCFGLTACTKKNSTPHEHKFSTDWSTDDTNHWHSAICEHEEEKSDVEAHSYSNACDPDCDVCGYTRTVGDHVYDNACDTSCNTCGALRTITHAHADTSTMTAQSLLKQIISLLMRLSVSFLKADFPMAQSRVSLSALF